jgi:DNA-binding response OmpR family regulator
MGWGMMSTNSVDRRVLVIEDEPAIGLICTRTLTAEGFEVKIVTKGKIARTMLHNEEYDLYIIDIRIPEVNGMELYKYLEEEHPEWARRVIFSSGDVLSGDTGSFVKRTGQPFLSKPFTPDQLRAMVRKTMSELLADGKTASVKV